MNETEIRGALHGVMTVVEQPAAMDADLVIAAARQARKRRQNVSAGTGAAVAVVAVATTAVMLPLGGGSGLEPGGPSPSASNTAEAGAKTASSGPHHAQGAALLDALTDARPDGFGAPTDLRSEPDGSGDTFPLRHHQATRDGFYGDSNTWAYSADMPVSKNGRVGRLYAEVVTSATGLPADPCDLANEFWGMSGNDCEVIAVDGKQVGVVSKPERWDQFTQWAAYRHPDGTVVFVAQAKSRAMAAGDPEPLAERPFTVQQLAELATDERFRLR